MANEIQINASLTISQNGLQVTGQLQGLQLNLNGPMLGNEQSIGTENQQLVLTGVTAPCILFVKNLDTVNYVEISLDNAQADVISKLQPGQACLVFLETATVYAKAHTGAVNVAIAAGSL